ncbi:MAG: AsmA-like C-terminal region-containing protein, partial [Bacteroidia bacterium]
GIATASIDFSSRWSRALAVDPKSIVASCDLTIERGQLVNYKPLESLSKYVELKELQDIKFATLQSRIEIKEEVISISRTSIKNNAMNMDFYGTHTFNNEIDYHIRLLLSEVLAKRPGKNKQLDEELSLVENDPDNKRAVFLTMTGTLDKPIIKYDRRGMKDKIKEDIKEEKKNLKKILFEEFGLFKKDTANFKNKNEEVKKADQKFQVDFGDQKKKEGKRQETPLKEKGKTIKEETEDDGDF